MNETTCFFKESKLSLVAMSESIHGHEVLAMMTMASQPFTRASLITAINQKFGQEARFYTCSAANLTAPELVQFLESRGKFIAQEDSFVLDKSKVCNHH